MLSGSAFWNRSASMKSISARAPFSFFAPSRTPASSTCRKQVAVTAAVGAVFVGFVANITSAGGLVAYETTIGRLPLLPPAPENCAVYASSQPSTTRTPFARSRRQ